jgi:hypothetical protein
LISIILSIIIVIVIVIVAFVSFLSSPVFVASYSFSAPIPLESKESHACIQGERLATAWHIFLTPLLADAPAGGLDLDSRLRQGPSWQGPCDDERE